ncbi:MAG: HAMP domain-containing histidine kinase [Spirochaetes bacterium]|nr:HAMP domain-containing histidine kinase [Spirochaetota bacterium]
MTDHEELLEFFYVTPMAIAQTDLEGFVLYMNPFMNSLVMQLRGLPADPLVKVNLIEVISKYDLMIKALLKKMLSKNTHQILPLYDLKTNLPGENKYLRLKVTRLGKEKMIFILQDVTRLKEQEIALQKSDALKTKLFSIIAHDLRGPIGSIVNALEMLAVQSDLFDENTLKGMLLELSRSSKATFSLLENLLYWSRNQMGNTRFKPQAVDLKQVVNQKMDLYQLLAKEKEVQIIQSIPEKCPLIFADINMIEAIVRNLITNAIKFSQSQQKIQIEILDKKSELNLIIADQGVGMSQEQIDKIMTEKEVVSTFGTRGEKGTGLGLLLILDFVEKNSGKLDIESKPGTGTKMIVTFPILADSEKSK